MMIDGRRYLTDEGYIPDYVELGRILSRVPRWNGQTIVPWSVLQHSLVVGKAAALEEDHPVELLKAYLHDIEEAVIGDTPYPFKTEQQRQLGNDIRARMLREIFGLPGDLSVEYHALDREVAAAEVMVLGHPNWLRHMGSDATPRDEVVDLVMGLLDADPREATFLWETAVRPLMEAKEVRALIRRSQ